MTTGGSSDMTQLQGIKQDVCGEGHLIKHSHSHHDFKLKSITVITDTESPVFFSAEADHST